MEAGLLEWFGPPTATGHQQDETEQEHHPASNHQDVADEIEIDELELHIDREDEDRSNDEQHYSGSDTHNYILPSVHSSLSAHKAPAGPVDDHTLETLWLRAADTTRRSANLRSEYRKFEL